MSAPHILAEVLALTCGAAAMFGIACTIIATLLIGRFFRRPVSEPESYPPVTLVIPLHGAESGLLDNLVGFCKQEYRGALQFLFGVQNPDDPAIRTVDALRLLHPEATVTMIADTRLHGPNRKISNLLNMLPHAQHDVLVFVDSDVTVGPGFVRNIVGELQKPDVGLVTCMYRGKPEPGIWTRLSAKATNYQFLPGVMLGLASGLARPCFGQTIAMRRATLDRIGGLEPFVRHLAEDHAIGEAVRLQGEKVAIPPFTVAHACVERSARQLIAHELRWSRTIRGIDRSGHLGSVLMYPLAFALLAVILSGAASWSVALVLAALGARLALKVWSDHVFGQAQRDLWLLPVWDIVSFLIFIASFWSTRVTWRGFSFEVDQNGLLTAVQDEQVGE